MYYVAKDENNIRNRMRKKCAVWRSMVTLTIIPWPSDSTVVINASGYRQEGNSITVLEGTQISYVVSSNIDWANVSGWYTGTTAVGQCGVTDIAATPSDKTSTGFKLQKCSEHSWYLCGYMA